MHASYNIRHRKIQWLDKNFRSRNAIIKIRTSSHWLDTEKGRHSVMMIPKTRHAEGSAKIQCYQWKKFDNIMADYYTFVTLTKTSKFKYLLHAASAQHFTW